MTDTSLSDKFKLYEFKSKKAPKPFAYWPPEIYGDADKKLFPPLPIQADRKPSANVRKINLDVCVATHVGEDEIKFAEKHTGAINAAFTKFETEAIAKRKQKTVSADEIAELQSLETGFESAVKMFQQNTEVYHTPEKGLRKLADDNDFYLAHRTFQKPAPPEIRAVKYYYFPELQYPPEIWDND